MPSKKNNASNSVPTEDHRVDAPATDWAELRHIFSRYVGEHPENDL